jgi:hypothetical protein
LSQTLDECPFLVYPDVSERTASSFVDLDEDPENVVWVNSLFRQGSGQVQFFSFAPTPDHFEVSDALSTKHMSFFD